MEALPGEPHCESRCQHTCPEIRLITAVNAAITLTTWAGLVFRVCLIGFPYRLGLKRQLFIEAFCQFFYFEVFAILRALLRVCLLGCHVQSLPQTGQVDYCVARLYGAKHLGVAKSWLFDD